MVKKGNRKNKIIKEAIVLFADKGYHGTTLDEIAKKAGITKAALYYYFRGKEDLIRCIFEYSAERMDKVISLEKSNLSPKEKLIEFIRYHIKFGSDTKELSQITFEQTHALPRKTRDAFNRKKKQVDATLQKVLLEGVKDGSIKVDDVQIASYAILGMCNWTYRWYNPHGRLTPEQISDICINLLENGYLNKQIDTC